MKTTVTLELPDEVLAALTESPVGLEKIVEHILCRDYKIQHRVGVSKNQFDMTTKEGLLRRVFYYQRRANGLKGDLPSFIKKWSNKKRFIKLWGKYEKKKFKKSYMPTFVKDDAQGFRICHFKYRNNFGVGF